MLSAFAISTSWRCPERAQFSCKVLDEQICRAVVATFAVALRRNSLSGGGGESGSSSRTERRPMVTCVRRLEL
jgi:hypothetical protein